MKIGQIARADSRCAMCCRAASASLSAGAHQRPDDRRLERGPPLWADRYDRDLTDIFAIQDEIAHAIVGQLKIKMRPEEVRALESDPTTNVEAYTYYLRGRKFARSMTMSYLIMARRMFYKAIELDPDYARAYAGIADCDSALYIWYAAEPLIGEILEMTEKALALDPALAEAHAARAIALHHADCDQEADIYFARALALIPISSRPIFTSLTPPVQARPVRGGDRLFRTLGASRR